MSTVIANNGSSANTVSVTSSVVTPALSSESSANNISAFSASLSDSTNYKVSFGYSAKGLIDSVTIATAP